MTNMRGWIYHIDTTLDSDPQYRNDQDMQYQAEGLEDFYCRLEIREWVQLFWVKIGGDQEGEIGFGRGNLNY